MILISIELYDDVKVKTQIGNPDNVGVLPKIFTETVGIEDLPTQIQQRNVTNTFFLGDAVNGKLGTANGTGGSQIVLGFDDRLITLVQVINTNKLFREHFRFTDFKDSTNNASDWDTYAKSLSLSNVLAHYTFNSDSSDSSGNGINGTDSNISYVSGHIGNAASFGGTNSKILTSSSTLSVNQWSVSLWVNFTAVPGAGTQKYILEAYNTTNNNNNFTILIDGGNIYFYVYDQSYSTNSFRKKYYSTATYTTATWYHIVVTWDGTNFKIYENGTLNTNPTKVQDSAVTQTNQTRVITFGSTYSGGGYLNGLIDECQIYKYAITQAQVTALYNSGTGTTSTLSSSAQSSSIAYNDGTVTQATLSLTGNSILAHYTLNGNSNDISGNGYNGTDSNMSYIGGKINDCGNFNGTTSNIQFGSNFGFERTTPFSVSMWIYQNDLGVAEVLMGKAKTDASAGGYFITRETNNKIYLYLVNQFGSNAIAVNGGTALSISAWYHVTVTYDGSSSASGVKIYINSNLETLTTTQDTLSSSILTSINAQISGRNGNTQNFNGLIDDVRIYSYVLSATEISTLYNSGNGREDEIFPLITVYLSADGGVHWETVSNGIPHIFTNQGIDLRYKLVASGTATVTLVEINYG